MTLEERINRFEYDIGSSLNGIFSRDFYKPINYLGLPWAGLKLAGNLTKDAYQGTVKAAKDAKNKVKENFEEGKLEGTKKTLVDIVKQSGKGATKTLHTAAKTAFSLPGVGLVAGSSLVLSNYLDNMKGTFPFHLTLNKPSDIVKFPFRLVGNIGYNIGKNLYGFTSGVGKGIIHGDFGEIKDGFSSLIDIGSIDKRVIENISFRNTKESIDSLVTLSPYIMGTMALGALALYGGKKLYKKIKNLPQEKKDTTHLINKAGKGALAAGTSLGLVGYASNFYHTVLHPYKFGHSMINAALTVTDFAFGFITVPIKVAKYGLDYFLGRGLPDSVSLFAGKYAGNVAHVIENITTQQAASLMKYGATSALVGSALYGAACYKHFKDQEKKQPILLDKPLAQAA